jgi:hypothetical protein
MNVRKLATGGAVAALCLTGGALGATLIGSANAAPSPSPTSGTTTEDAHPGDNGADGDGDGHGGHGLDLSGTVTAVGSSSVTITTSTGTTTTYTVGSDSDIDKSGEASLTDLKAGDAVTFSVESDGTTIDKLHAGDETQNAPSTTASASPST